MSAVTGRLAGMPAPATTGSAAVLARVITAMAGPDARPREDQVRAVEELVEHGRKVLVVQATGWGKSAVYWAATAALRERGAGPTLVVSPLLSLMRDLVPARRPVLGDKQFLLTFNGPRTFPLNSCRVIRKPSKRRP